MAENVTNELMYEILKDIRGELASMQKDVADIKRSQLRMREDFHRFEGDILRFDRMQAETQLRLERIEVRLELRDAE